MARLGRAGGVALTDERVSLLLSLELVKYTIQVSRPTNRNQGDVWFMP
jgi:hypothetical protein